MSERVKKTYKVSKECLDMLAPFGGAVTELMVHYLNQYFATGKNPNFNDDELRNIWFYIKTHELADQVQRNGYCWYGTFAHIELISLLNKYGKKLENPHYIMRTAKGNC